MCGVEDAMQDILYGVDELELELELQLKLCHIICRA